METDAITFIGNATTLIRYGGFTLLTDPNFVRRGEKVRLGYGLTARRLKNPATSIADLPALDAVVLSHLHEDHWDRIVDRRLDRSVPVLTTPAGARALRRRGFGEAEGLRTWRDQTLDKDGRYLRVTALPGRHAPGPLHRLLPPVMGSLLEFGRRGADPDLRVYVSGDTLMYDGLAEIPRRHPGIDIGIVHLGGTKLLRTLLVTMDGRQGADWLEMTRCSAVVPVHYDDYNVFTSPLSDFRAEAARRGLTGRVRVVERGRSLPLPHPAPAVTRPSRG